jgi:nitrate reductase NapAB chaperone NapD
MAKNPCKYLIEIAKGEFKEFTEPELKDYLLSQDLSKLKSIQNAIQERAAEEKVSRPTGAGKNIPEGGARVRPSEQGTKVTKEAKGNEEAVRMRSLYKQIITRATGLTEEQKSILESDPNALYTVLPIAKTKKLALELIQEMGVAEAVAEASSPTTTLQPVERTMILGAAMDYYASLGKESLKEGDDSAAQKAAIKEIDANEELQKIASTLGTLGTAYGRAINAFKEIYKLSSLALERKLVESVEELNEARASETKSNVKEIKKIITDEASDIKEVANKLTEGEVEKSTTKKVSELEKDVENLRKEILERDKAQKGTKKNPLKIKRITNDTEYDKRIKEFKQRARSIVSKDDLLDLTYFGLYHIENGVTKFTDWYNTMSKDFKGFKSQFKNIYSSVRDKAIENGAKKELFDTDESAQSILDDFQQETDAKKLAKASEKLVQAKLKKEEENNPDRAIKLAPSLAAERIRKDAEKNLDLPSTEVEQTYLKRLVKVINNKAKEYYAEKKENISNINDVLAFAIANGKKDFSIWERTQTELEEQIDADEKLTEEQKQEVKDFLDDYRKSIFDTLLTKNQISVAVREKLIEKGYFTEKIINGKAVKSVDWNKIIGNVSTAKEAKENIVSSITDLGFTEAEAKAEINSILDKFDSEIADRKTKQINKYLNKGILNKVKTISTKVPKTSVDKLVDLNRKGLLDDAKIKDILSAELGLMTITDTDLKNLREWSSKVDDENTPIFIKKEFEEKIQYLFDSKGGSINFLENRAASMSNRLSSVVNQIVNLTGFLRAPSTLITVAVKTGKPIQATRVFLKELINASEEAKTILKGRVSRGTSFDDAVGAASGPRVRYLEQGKGKFLGGKFLGKPLYLEIGGKKVDLNPINLGYSKIKYIPRLLESADTMASGAISGVTQFRAATKEINKYFPELSAAEKSQKVYDIMYSGDIAAETTKAIRDLKNSGVSEPTIAEINRTVNERVERARNERLAQEFYKQVESLNDISETKLKADGIANPTKEEILAESYKTLGATEAADIVARGERQAARETGKMSTVGITSIILLPVDMIQKKLNQGVKNKSKAVSTLSEAGDVAFSITFPFANSIARWAEMGAELFTPYGLLKGTGYKIAAKFTSKDSKIPAEEYSELGDDYFIRGIQGAAITITIMYGVALLNKIDDDEEREKLGKSFTGTAKEKQYAQERVESVGKPKQTVNIRGTNIPLAFLGSQGLVIGMWADYLKLKGESKLDKNMQERGELYISSLAAMQAFASYIFDATYLSSAKKYGSAASSLVEMKEEGYAPTLGRLAGGIISSQIPFNRLQVEAATLYNPKSQSSKEFGSNLLAQMSIVRAFQSGKPNFDYRGREYDYGDIYANSADGVRKMFGKAKYGDKIDAFLSEINFAATDAYRETRDEDNYKFSITNPDYTHRFMTNDEYYEFKRKTANKFNEQITAKYEEINRRVNKITNPERYDLDGIKKKIVSELLSKAKDEAFEEVQNSIFKPSKAKLSRAKNKEEAISEKVSSLVRKFKKK